MAEILPIQRNSIQSIMALPREVCNVIECKKRVTPIDRGLTPQRKITFVNLKVVYTCLMFKKIKSRTTGTISTNLSIKLSWIKGIKMCNLDVLGLLLFLQYMVSLLLFLVTDMVFIALFAVLLDNVSTYLNSLHTHIYLYNIFPRNCPQDIVYENYLWISSTIRLRIKILKVL